MGLKASVFAVYEGDAGYFGSSPVPDARRSAELARRLPLRINGGGEPRPLELWPRASLVGVGAYERGALVVHQSLLDECMRADGHPVTVTLQDLYSEAVFVSFGLHSVVNYFGYTVIDHGRIRSFGGAEDHIDVDVGELVPEEIRHFENSTVREGVRLFTSLDDPGEEFDAPAYGEVLVASISERLFGQPVDRLREAPVDLHYFQRRPWWRIWG